METVTMHRARHRNVGYHGNVQVPRLTMGREHNAGQFQNDAVRTLHEMTRFDAERERDPAG